MFITNFIFGKETQIVKYLDYVGYISTGLDMLTSCCFTLRSYSTVATSTHFYLKFSHTLM